MDSDKRGMLSKIVSLALLATTFFVLIGSVYDPSFTRMRYQKNYQAMKSQLDSGVTKIDYAQFRRSYYKSGAYEEMDRPRISSISLGLMDCRNGWAVNPFDKDYYECVRAKTLRIIAINPADIFSRKLLADAYLALGDSAASRKHRSILKGLLESIEASGDGKTCGTAWKVYTMLEEQTYGYFGFDTSVDLKKHVPSNADSTCAKAIARGDETLDTVYFDLSDVPVLDRLWW